MKVILLVMVLFIPVAYGTVITGEVYDFQLDHAENAIVEIDTAPAQKLVVKDSYSIEVPKGSYTITAKIIKEGEAISFVAENITVKEDGNYSLDLITFPIIEDVPQIEDISTDVEVPEKNPSYLALAIILFVLIASVIILSLLNKPGSHEQKKESSEQLTLQSDVAQIYEFIRKEGRATQKEIRQRFPLSEAKISLMITELEGKGLVKRIKKGRGNIITLP